VAREIDPIELMPVSRFGRPIRTVLRAWAVVTLLILYLPTALLILFSFGESPTPGLPFRGPTLRWYEEMLGNDILLGALWNSILVAAAVAGLATIIGTMAAFPLVRGGVRWPGAARIIFTMPIMVPGFLIGIGLLIFFRRVLATDLSLATVIAGHLTFTVPFVVLLVAARLEGFDRRLEWAAADLGADGARTIRHIVLPLIMPAILAGALISVTLSLDEFVITFFTIGPQLTLPLYIYTQIKFGVTPEVNAVATVLMVGSLALLGLGMAAGRAGRLASWRRRRKGND
jgi:ABC-type spermidine/putrescine transport system permease subunit II